ncbi:hypothetical protein [Luteolibacter luteus]|uniref:Uncharacterized protein n=1 Tax=Luteolibacter luteus TaxID=2728835 RepID=A0A858RNE7_9BACT|nr:hypothetical protein [Luteolibacter luteus]QJE98121.1 hypothetical protein HHL09_20815 [Luteolibacter luteus]
MDQELQEEERGFPRIYLHCTAFAVMAATFFLILVLHGDLHRLEDAWGVIVVACFPAVFVEVLLRSRVERPIWPAAILAAMIGWDIASRLG